MYRMMRFLLLLLLPFTVSAQTDSLASLPEYNGLTIQNNNTDSLFNSSPFKLKAKQFIVPAALIGYGLLATDAKFFKNINLDVRNEIVANHPNFKTKIDDYTRIVPGAAVFVLQAFGIKGESSVKKEAVVYAMSVGISTATVFSTKRLTHQERPDGSDRRSFPSGHATLAFASAEFLRREYWHVSPWIGVAGYAVATGTGILRLYNNKHWLGDVAAGAGVGILSTTLSYWLYDKIHIGGDNQRTISFFPGYSNRQFTVGFVKQF